MARTTNEATHTGTGGLLLERAELLAALDEGVESAEEGRGRIVLVSGEAGVGKTALLTTLRDRRGTEILWGSCERLFSPRALGPFVDIANQLGAPLSGIVRAGAPPDEFVRALIGILSDGTTRILVIEDLHWADEGTLDVLKLLAHRIEQCRVLLVMSYRADQLRPTDPLQIVLGELSSVPYGSHLLVEPLSLTAVSTLAGESRVDVERLFQLTGGNPFFVTEVLATNDTQLPATVRDAVLARAAQLPTIPRRLLDAIAIVPTRGVEPWLLEAIALDDANELETSLRSGIVRVENNAVMFRHEIARLAIDEAIDPQRRLTLHRRALDALTESPAGLVDVARLSYHASEAGDIQNVLKFAPAAGERAAALGSHVQAAKHYDKALRYADALPLHRQAELYERLAIERHLANGDPAAALEAARAALTLRRALGQHLQQGEILGLTARLLWYGGRPDEAEAAAREAVDIIATTHNEHALAMAFADLGRIKMHAHKLEEAESWAVRAIELGERLHADVALASALDSLGVVQLRAGRMEGWANLERSAKLADAAKSDQELQRALISLAVAAVDHRLGERADDAIRRAAEFTAEHELWAHRFVIALRSRHHFENGRFEEALDDARAALRVAPSFALHRVTALVVIGRIQARRDEPEAWATLDEALKAMVPEDVIQVASVAIARAEALWLSQQYERIGPETDAAYELALHRRAARFANELAYWRWKGGVDDERPLLAIDPYAAQIAGDWAAAVAQWKALGRTYDAALAQAESEEEEQLHMALVEFRRSSSAAARATVLRLRELGMKVPGRGLGRSTVNAPAQLTARQLQILVLLGKHLTNAEIAAATCISPKTVDHHVSAILGKLGVRSRREAVNEAIRLGVMHS